MLHIFDQNLRPKGSELDGHDDRKKSYFETFLSHTVFMK